MIKKKLEDYLEDELKISVPEWDHVEIDVKYNPDRIKLVLEGFWNPASEVK